MTRLDIINRALMKCGLALAASINDCDWNASITFEDCAAEVLRSFCWGFCQRLVSLAPAQAPQCGFEKAWQLPSDFLRMVDVRTSHDMRSPRCRSVRVVGNVIYTQCAPCYLRYISNSVEPEDWPPDFCDAVACRIACEIAPLSTQSMAIAPQLMQLYQLSLATAQATDSRENAERVPRDIDIWSSRGGYEAKRG